MSEVSQPSTAALNAGASATDAASTDRSSFIIVSGRFALGPVLYVTRYAGYDVWFSYFMTAYMAAEELLDSRRTTPSTLSSPGGGGPLVQSCRCCRRRHHHAIHPGTTP